LYDKNKFSKINEEIYTTVQPDLCVICDITKLDSRGCLGSPDWIIEIVSKQNSKRDVKIKYQLYQECGVKEYWTIFPSEEVIYQFVLNEETQQYQLIGIFANEGEAIPYLFPELKVDLEEIFANL
jgi:Uma2 family endonuclease